MGNENNNNRKNEIQVRDGLDKSKMIQSVKNRLSNKALSKNFSGATFINTLARYFKIDESDRKEFIRLSSSLSENSGDVSAKEKFRLLTLMIDIVNYLTYQIEKNEWTETFVSYVESVQDAGYSDDVLIASLLAGILTGEDMTDGVTF